MSVVVRVAASPDTAVLARLRWTWRGDEEHEPAVGAFDAFASALKQWWAAHPEHVALLAMDCVAERVPIGMARLAIGDRVPSPYERRRRSAWLQSVYVVLRFDDTVASTHRTMDRAAH